jgi:hypothetical protein
VNQPDVARRPSLAKSVAFSLLALLLAGGLAVAIPDRRRGARIVLGSAIC